MRKNAAIARRTNPPTTPPMMAPVGDLFVGQPLPGQDAGDSIVELGGLDGYDGFGGYGGVSGTIKLGPLQVNAFVSKLLNAATPPPEME